MLAEKTQHTFFVFWFYRFPVFPSFGKNLVNFLHRLTLSCNSDDIQFSFHNINFNQITFFYKCDRTAVNRYEGPKGSGMPEMFYTSEAISSDKELGKSIALITDGRFSGARFPRRIAILPSVPIAFSYGRIISSFVRFT